MHSFLVNKPQEADPMVQQPVPRAYFDMRVLEVASGILAGRKFGEADVIAHLRFTFGFLREIKIRSWDPISEPIFTTLSLQRGT